MLYHIGNVNSIATQTKLLSLNASIEAGSGFAVVAGEIRALSDESAGAANNIQKNLEGLDNIVELVSEKISEGSKAAKRGYDEMDKIAEVLGVISTTSETVGVVIEEEKQIIDKINDEFVKISEEVGNIVNVSEKNSEMILSIHENVEKQGDTIADFEEKMNSIHTLAEDIIN